VRDAVELAGYEAWSLELAGLRSSSRLHELALGGRFADGRASLVVALDRPRTPPRLDYEERRLERCNPRWLDESHDPGGLLGGLFALHRARWVARGERSTRFDAALERFHRDVVEAMTPRGLVRMIGVALDGELRGVLYGFSDHGRFLFYLSGFDPDLARLSPGRLLIARAIDRARDEGAFELDFLRGREPYKYEWGAIERPSATYRAELGRELRAGNSLDHR
jgi:CelD/BcsL family acetyltransferase involved in cellulose biosynthesis